MDTVDDILQHHGIKGMKWGVRRDTASRDTPSQVNIRAKTSRRGAQDINVRTKAGRGITRVSGGRRNIANVDAMAAAAARQKAKTSTVHALSNKELKDALARMKLEQDFAKASKQNAKLTSGKSFMNTFMRMAGAASASATFSGGGAPAYATAVAGRRAIGA